MNISDPLWNGPQISEQAPLTDNDNNSDLSQSQTESIVSAILNSGSHLFTFKEFLYVGTTLTVVTLGLPMLGGPFFRVVVRSAKRNFGKWRFVVMLVYFSYTWVAIYVLSNRREILFTTLVLPSSALGFYLTAVDRASRSGIFKIQMKSDWPKVWIAYWSTAAASGITVLEVQHHNFWLLVPIFYLFLVAISANRNLLFRFRILSKETILRIPELKTKYRKYFVWLLVLLSVVARIGSLFAQLLVSTITTYLFGIYLGLYAAGKYLVHRQRRAEWTLFFMAVVGCMICDVIVAYSPTLPVVPLAFRVGYCLYIDDRVFITKYLPQWMGRKRIIARPRGSRAATDAEAAIHIEIPEAR